MTDSQYLPLCCTLVYLVSVGVAFLFIWSGVRVGAWADEDEKAREEKQP